MEIDPTRIDWASLEAAFCYRAPDRRAYLDLASGQVAILREGEPASSGTLARIVAEPGRFLGIESVPAREQHGWITGFIASIEDAALRESLGRAVAGPGAFRLFKQQLRAHPDEVQRWFRVRSALLRPHIVAWLQANEVRLTAAPAVTTRPPDGGDASEGRQRRFAHAQLDALPDAALDLAVSYLRFLVRTSA